MSNNNLKYDQNGLIPAVVQDAATREVLMVAWMNAEALRLTQASGEAHFWSRSRQKLWHKGATSGNVQRVREIRYENVPEQLVSIAAISEVETMLTAGERWTGFL